MAAAYADVAAYRSDTGDESSPDARVASALSQQSAKLRALLGIRAGRALDADQAELARALVVDAVRKQLVPPSIDGVGEVAGAKQVSFSANGFQSGYTLANPSGSAYFDGSLLKALRRALGPSQRAYSFMPGGIR